MFTKKTTAVFTSALILAAAAPAALGQPTFSIDHQGPTLGVPDSFTLGPITEGDILSAPIGGPPIGFPAPGPLPPPGTVIPVGALGVFISPLGRAEVDAMSYGRDARQGQWYFSVDEFAMGLPGAPVAPNVTSEGAAGAMEASADVYTGLVPPGPVPPFGVFGNTGLLDGNGMPPFGGPGLGLIEPNPPTPGTPFDPGDNLDAVNIDTTVVDIGGPVFLSLDTTFGDPIEGPGANTGTAAANGFVGGDVLISTGGVLGVYAPAVMLGLDLAAGFVDSDDLDALALNDNGDGIYTPGLDTIYFSVRRGSAVIGMPDSIWGVPIEEGDILVPPVVPGAFPGIWVPGEALGLATLRMGVLPGQQFGDDLDALDVVPEPATVSFLILGGLALLRRRR